MGIPQLESCCCGCSLKLGTKIIGWVHLVQSVFLVIMLCLSEAAFYYIEEHPSKKTEDIRPYLPVLKITGFIAIISQLIQCGLGIILLLGVYQNKAQFVLTWVVATLAMVIISLVNATCEAMVYYEASQSGNIIGLLVSFYFILVVYSYYREIQNVSTNYA